MKLIYGILLASLSAAAVDAVYNGGFESEAKKVSAAMVRNMKNKNWQIEEPLRMPSSWIPNGFMKRGMVKYPDPQAAEGKTAFTFRGVMRCTKFVSRKGLQDKLTLKFFSRGGAGYVGVYLYGDKSVFLSEIRKPFEVSAEWKEQNLEIIIPKEVRKKPVKTLCICFGSGGAQEISLDRVSAVIPPIPGERKPEVKKAGMEEVSFGNATLNPKENRTFTFKQADNDTRQIRLVLDARIDWSNLGGYTSAMTLTVNGEKLTGSRLLNKPLKFKTRSGGDTNWAAPTSNGYILMYSPDFSDKIKTNQKYIYGLYEENQHPYRFVFDLTGLTRHVGENQVTVSATWRTIVIQNVRIQFDKEYLPRINDKTETVQPAPTGALPLLTEKSLTPADIQIASAPGKSFVMKTAAGDFPVATRLSLPDGKWLDTSDGKADEQTWSAPDYTMTRTIRKAPHRLIVTDCFTNLKDRPVGVILENTVFLPMKADHVTVSGRELMLAEYRLGGGNPSLTAEMEKSCLILLLEDDILRSQARGWNTAKSLTFTDRQLALPPKGSHTLEWSLYYSDSGSYYDLINEIRKDWKVNFTINGPFSFPYGGGTGGIPFNFWIKKVITADQVGKFLQKRKVRTIITHVPGNYSIPVAKETREKPYLGHGTALRDPGFTSWRNQTRAMTAALKKYAPEVQVHCYIHKNICTELNNRGKYRDSEVLPGGTYDRLGRSGVNSYYVPTANNSYGKKLRETYLYMLDDLGTNIYMDEICLGVTETGKYPEWDQCTGQIDPNTHQLVDTVSMPNLLERPWMEQMMADLKKRGRKLIGNAPPVTAALRDFKTVSFIEKGMGVGGLYSMHLSTPLGFCYGVGDKGYKHFKLGIQYGIVCFQYSDEWNALCFPLTPREIRPGYVIADERIITGCSGTFGWREGSDADIFVYDGQGKPASAAMVTKRRADGKFLFDVRIPSDHLVILVRKGK